MTWRRRGVAVGGLEVEADDEPLGVGDAHLSDMQVVRRLLVAAGVGQRCLGVGRARAELLAKDVAVPAGAQVAAVNARSPTHTIRARVTSRRWPGLADQCGVVGVAGQDHTRTGDAGAGDRHSDLRQVAASVLALAPGAKPRPARLLWFAVGRAVGLVTGGLGRSRSGRDDARRSFAGHRTVASWILKYGEVASTNSRSTSRSRREATDHTPRVRSARRPRSAGQSPGSTCRPPDSHVRWPAGRPARSPAR
jgi:hypothetical protein